jgi:hypothetical protein
MGDDQGRRGLLGRVRRKVKGGLSKVKDGLQALNDEAKHPGRPPAHHAADSPFWQDADKRMPAGQAKEPPPPPPGDPTVPKPTDTTDRDGEPFWFMQDEEDLEGWEQTNPSAAWRERHGVEGSDKADADG